MSESTLWSALVAFQAEAPTLPKDGINPHFKSKFTPLDTIVEQIQPLLAKHGLAWTTLPSTDADGRAVLRYRLIHGPSGESLSDEMPLMVGGKQTMQDLGGTITYARRYAITAVLNLVADEDDDGNRTSRPVQRQAPVAPSLSDETAASVTEALSNADPGQERLRQWLVAIGVQNVPTKVTRGTIRTLTEPQAHELIGLCSALVDQEAAAMADAEMVGVDE